jgi:EpsI family protein
VSARIAIATAVLVAMRLYSVVAVTDRPAPRAQLALLPLHLGSWTGRDASPFADDVVNVLGVDDYVNRVYVAPAAAPVGLYVGYYATQRQGDTIHSPQNCLPGAGWQPVTSSRIELRAGAAGGTVQVNRVVIQKALDRQVVLYWYAGRGRTIASDYANKWWLTLDAARLHRTDGGLVRIIAPIVDDSSPSASDAAAFATLLLSVLPRYLP